MYEVRKSRLIKRHARKKAMRKARNKKIFARWKRRMLKHINGED